MQRRRGVKGSLGLWLGVAEGVKVVGVVEGVKVVGVVEGVTVVGLGLVSTWMGVRLEIPGALCSFRERDRKSTRLNSSH